MALPPYLLMISYFSTEIISGIVMAALYPLTAAIMAKADPVLPPEASIRVQPSLIIPLFSASSTIQRAVLSLTLPPGFKCSHFPRILHPVA